MASAKKTKELGLWQLGSHPFHPPVPSTLRWSVPVAMWLGTANPSVTIVSNNWDQSKSYSVNDHKMVKMWNFMWKKGRVV